MIIFDVIKELDDSIDIIEKWCEINYMKLDYKKSGIMNLKGNINYNNKITFNKKIKCNEKVKIMVKQIIMIIQIQIMKQIKVNIKKYQ